MDTGITRRESSSASVAFAITTTGATGDLDVRRPMNQELQS
jgi:hypothetical protein